MDRANLTEDFNWDAVLQITERDYPVAEVAARLDQHILALRIEGTASTAIRHKGACISPAFGNVSQPDLVDYAAVRQAIVYHGELPRRGHLRSRFEAPVEGFASELRRLGGSPGT